MASSMEGLNDIITCSLCFEVFNGKERLPKCLPCSHTFCLDCLHKLVTSKADFNIPCPLCNIKYQVPTGGAVAIPTNIPIKQICENLQQKKSTAVTCKIHSENSIFICEVCCEPLCEDCMLGLHEGKHKDHKYQKVQTFIASIRSKAKDVSAKLEEEHAKLDRLISNNNESLLQQEDELIEAANGRAKKAHNEVDAWLTTTVKAIKATFAKHTAKSPQTKATAVKDVESSIACGDVVKANRDLASMKDVLKNIQDACLEQSDYVSPICGLTDTYLIDLGCFRNKPEIRVAQTGPTVVHLSMSDVGSNVNDIIGLMKNKAVLAKGKSLILLESTNDKYNQVWEKPLPEGQGCRKYLLQNQHILLQNGYNAPTKEFSGELRHIRDYAGDIGKLIGVLPSNLLAYSDHDKKVSLYRYPSFDKVVTLNVSYSSRASICANPVTGQLAVATGNHTLHIFNATGKVLHETIMEGMLRSINNALAATSMYILVMLYDPVAILVYNWEGRKLAHINHNRLMLSDSCGVNYLDAITTIGEHQFVIAVKDQKNKKHMLKVFNMH